MKELGSAAALLLILVLVSPPFAGAVGVCGFLLWIVYIVGKGTKAAAVATTAKIKKSHQRRAALAEARATVARRDEQRRDVQKREQWRLMQQEQERLAAVGTAYAELERLSQQIGALPLSNAEKTRIGQYMKQKLFKKLRKIIDER